MNWKGCGRKRLAPDLRHHHRCLEGNDKQLSGQWISGLRSKPTIKESSTNTSDLTKIKCESRRMLDFTPFKINFEQFTTAGNKTLNYRVQNSAYSALEYAFPSQLIATLHPKTHGLLNFIPSL